MSSLNKSNVTAYKDDRTVNMNGADTISRTYALQDVQLRVVRVPNQKVYQIFGEEMTNAKAYYLIYLEPSTPAIPQGYVVEVTGLINFIGEAKFTQQMTYVIDNNNREVYCVSNNE